MPNQLYDGDCVINGDSYDLYRDKERGPAWWKEGGLDLQEGKAKEPASAVWDRGWRDGMGETKRFSRDSKGYAFSENIDCTPDGYARLSARRITATPTNAPADAKTYFHQASSAGAATFHVGSLVKNTSAGTQTQTVAHGLSVAPKAMIFWSAGKTASGTVGGGFRAFFGVTDGTTQRGNAWRDTDAEAAPGTPGSAYHNAAIVIATGQAGSTAIQGGVLSANWGATNFQIDWTENDTAADIIHFVAVGGADVSAKVVGWVPSSGTGNKSVTGVGFAPTVVIHGVQANRTAVGTATDYYVGLGAMDGSGNQWAIGVSGSHGAATDTTRKQTKDKCLRVQGTGSGNDLDAASFVSMDSDGFTVNFTANTTPTALRFSLCLKGIRAKAGSWNKAVGAGPAADAVTGVGFTPGALILASFQNITASTGQAHARMGLGAGSAAGAVEASAFSSTDNLATTSTDGLDDTALIFEKIDNDTQTEDATATLTSLDSDGFTLSWATNDAVATEMLYLALATATSGSSYVYCHSGQRTWKMSVASNAITMVEEKDWTGTAVAGQPWKFETLWYLPLGGAVVFQELATIVDSGTDTWTAAGAGLYATAFTTAQDGSVARFLRGRPTNIVDLAATAPRTAGSWGDDFEVGDTSSAVVEAVDTGAMQSVSKTDGLYRFSTPGTATKVPFATTVDADGGVGLVGVSGTEVAFVSYPAGLGYTDGQHVKFVGPDTIRTNEAIPNVSLEPFRGRHYENAIFGRWIYSLYRVTESSTTRTYILAGYIHQLGANPLIEWHTPFMETGSARGLGIFEVNDKVTLWTQVGGQFVYRVIGQDGSPNAGRDSIGYGAASTSYNLYLPMDDMGLPNTLKHLRCFEIKTRGVDATCPVQLQILRDGGSAENVGATITGNGVSKRYWTLNTNDTERDGMPLLNITTTSGFDNTTADPQVWGVTIRTRPRPDRGGIYHIIIDTGSRYGEAKLRRDNLKALENGAPVTCLDPDGRSITLAVDDVRDLELKESEGAIFYTVEMFCEEFVNA